MMSRSASMVLGLMVVWRTIDANSVGEYRGRVGVRLFSISTLSRAVDSFADDHGSRAPSEQWYSMTSPPNFAAL